MRRYTNLFVFLFLLDGGISTADELLQLLLQVEFLGGIRNLVASMVIICAVPLYVGLGIDRRMPKRVVLPLLLYVFWSLVDSWFFPVLSGNRLYSLILSVTQLYIALLPYSPFRRAEERQLFFRREDFNGDFFSWRHTLTFLGVNLIVTPCALSMLFMAVLNGYAGRMTAGFMRVAPTGIYMSERVYQRADKTVRLVGMIHIGEKEFYDQLVESTTTGRTVILAEGVSDETHLMKTRFGYGRMAGVLGLTSQEGVRFKGRVVTEESLQQDGEAEQQSQQADVLRADTDLKEFRPTTVAFLEAAGRYLKESGSMAEGVREFNAWAAKNVTPEINISIFDDILHRRNQVVIGHLNKVLPRYDMIVIPWGALHMAEIEQAVLQQGFELRDEQKRLSIDYWKILGRVISGKGKDGRKVDK